MTNNQELTDVLREIRDDIRQSQRIRTEQHEQATREYADQRKESEQAYAKERRTSYHFWIVILTKVILVQAVAIVALALCLYMMALGG